jgi:ribonuclease D
LISSLSAALQAGFERDPQTLPRRPGRDPNHVSLTQAQVELQDRIKADRDRLAQQLRIEATLIANRAQLGRIARDPRQLTELLLPWQANLLRDQPSLKAAS